MAKAAFKHAKVSCITLTVPENFINIDDELEYFNNDPKLLSRNKKIMGLGIRHVIDDKTRFSDLCLDAAKRLFEKTGISKDSIDTLIVVTASPDYKYPPTACVLQGRLDLPDTCTCFDVTGLSCSGYGHGLYLAHSLVESGASKHCLVLGGDVNSLHSDRRNRNSNMLFGDGAGATLVEYTEEENPAYFLTGTRGKDFDKLIAPAGGYAIPVQKDIIDLEVSDDKGNVWHMWDDLMKGFDVFKFSTVVGPGGIKELLDYAQCSLDDIDYVAIHQANKQIVKTVAGFAQIPSDKYSAEAFSAYGNSGVSAVISDICHNLPKRKHDSVMLATFGVGMSCRFAILNLKNTIIYEVRFYKSPDDAKTRQELIEEWVEFYKKGNKQDE